MTKIKEIYIKFKECSIAQKVPFNVGNFVYYLYLRVTLQISIENFYTYKLYDRTMSHDDFYSTLHTAIHRWKVVSKNFMPNATKLWLITHKIDYLISKIRYPGLDAMDYFRYEFYKIKHCVRKTFITEGALVKMNKSFNGSAKALESEKLIADKACFNSLFSDIVKRKWLASYNCSKDGFDNFCNGQNEIIAKPIDGGAGKGIFKANVSSEENRQKLYNYVKNEEYILEEILIQHHTLRELNPASVNTVRVYSVYYKGEVHITGATLRIGVGNGPTDNYSGGGIAAEIDLDSGCVISHAVCQTGKSFYIHPITNRIIIGVKIPMWSEIQSMIKLAHLRLPELRYLGWDVVVCDDNSITLLEANTCAGVELQQHPSLTGKKYLYEKYI